LRFLRDKAPSGRNELEYVADILGAPINQSTAGKACVPDDSPYTTGGIGLLGTEPSEEALRHCDTLFIVGSSFPISSFIRNGRCEAVQLDGTRARIGLRHPIEVGLSPMQIGLTALVPLASPQEERKFLTVLKASMKNGGAMPG